jgi:DNA-binding transcriptional regulator LsrR (DeoR family)
VSVLTEIEALAVQLQEREVEAAKARARLVAAIKTAQGVSQADVARAAGLSRQRVGQLLHGDGAS